MKRILYAALAVVLVCGASPGAPGSGATEGRPVDVGVIHKANHPDFETMLEGFLAGLKVEGYEPKIVDTVAIDLDRHADKAVPAVRSMVMNGADILFSVGTITALEGERHETPVIEAAFPASYIGTKFEERDYYHYYRGNATGTRMAYPVQYAIQFSRNVFPEARRFAYLFNPDSPYTVPVAEFREWAAMFGFEIIGCPFSGSEDLPEALELACGAADVGFITKDVMAAGAGDVVLEHCEGRRFPMIFGGIPSAERGAFAAFQFNPRRSGEMCAVKAARVLGGESAQSIPVEHSDLYQLELNLRTAQELGLKTIPYQWISAALNIVE
ncbi:MAG: ABC transporter substrate-binding protein [Desulfatibacillaceae bacterium]